MWIVLGTACVSGHVAMGGAQAGSQEAEWRDCFGDTSGTKYSPLRRITDRREGELG
jgi:hypothetical protein